MFLFSVEISTGDKMPFRRGKLASCWPSTTSLLPGENQTLTIFSPPTLPHLFCFALSFLPAARCGSATLTCSFITPHKNLEGEVLGTNWKILVLQCLLLILTVLLIRCRFVKFLIGTSTGSWQMLQTEKS